MRKRNMDIDALVNRDTSMGPFKWVLRTDAFTLVELLIAMFVGLIAVGCIYSVYTTQQRSHRNQQLNMATQQNLRGAMMILEQEIRMAGYDPEESGRFGIVDIRRHSTVNSRDPDPNGQPAFFYTLDMDENGALDHRNGDRNREHPNFRIRDDQNVNRLYLAWDMGGGRQPLAENIHAIGFAYAVDADQDGEADRWNGGNHMIWAVDSDNDNQLDTHLDTNNDGHVDAKDDSNADQVIDAADGGRLEPTIGVDRIKAVRVWLLAVSSRPLQGHQQTGDLVVGDRVLSDNDDGRLRKVLETIIHCRNL